MVARMAKGKGSGDGRRHTKVRVKTAKKRKVGSTLWLERQLNDPYVKRAKADGYRSRAAYKLIELDEKFKFLKKGLKIVDLGAAPGGWTQVAVKAVGDGNVVALDILPMPAVPGAIVLTADFMDDAAPALLQQAMNGKADLVLSDMAPNTIGDPSTDHLRIMTLMEAAFIFACDVLKPGGGFIAKVWQGGTEQALLAEMKKRFKTVKHAKPASSRKDSAETFVVAMGFKL